MSKYLEFNTPATKQAMELASDFRLKSQGLTDLDRVFWNLPDEAWRKLPLEMKEAQTRSSRSQVNTRHEQRLINLLFRNKARMIKFGGALITVLSVLKSLIN
jgi:hypothetical protein